MQTQYSSCGKFTYRGTFKRGKRDGYCEVFDKENDKIIEKGTFKNGVFVKGERFIDGNWIIGSYNRDGTIFGYGEVYEGYEKKRLIEKGEYEDGHLIKGETFVMIIQEWFIGTFNNCKKLEGDGEVCEVYEGYEKKRLIQKGEFKNGLLVKGERFNGIDWGVGTFNKNNNLEGDGEVYEGYEKKRLIQKGVYKDGDLVKGERFEHGKWYFGTFKTAKEGWYMEGVGKVYFGYNRKRKLIEAGIFNDGDLVKGFKISGDTTYKGDFENDNIVSGSIDDGNRIVFGKFFFGLPDGVMTLINHTEKIERKALFDRGEMKYYV